MAHEMEAASVCIRVSKCMWWYAAHVLLCIVYVPEMYSIIIRDLILKTAVHLAVISLLIRSSGYCDWHMCTRFACDTLPTPPEASIFPTIDF